MSAATITKCDVCESVLAGSAYRPPAPWVAVDVRGSGIWASSDTRHACSKECAARLFYRLADESGGIPAPDPGNLLLSSKAYR